MSKTTGKKSARVLVDALILGVSVKANTLIEADSEIVEQHVKSGELDSGASAVKYCKDELLLEAIVIEKPLSAAEQLKLDLAEKRKVAETLVADLTDKLAAAADADKAAIEAQLKEAQALLDTLNK